MGVENYTLRVESGHSGRALVPSNVRLLRATVLSNEPAASTGTADAVAGLTIEFRRR